MATIKKPALNESIASFSTPGTEALKDGYQRMTQNLAEIAEFNRATIDVVMSAARTFARHVEGAASENNAFLKTSYDEAVAAAKSAAASKSVQEAFDIQSEFLRETFGRNLEQLNKFADQWMSTVKEVSEPLAQRYGEIVEKTQSYRP
jgi:phasin family protein